VAAELVIEVNMNTVKTSRSTELIATSVATAVAVATLAFLLVAGTLNSRSFAVGCLIVMSLSAVAWVLLLKRTNGLADDRRTAAPPTLQSHKGKQIRLVVLLILLAVSFWITRGGPWIPRLIGACVLVAFLMGTLRDRG